LKIEIQTSNFFKYLLYICLGILAIYWLIYFAEQKNLFLTILILLIILFAMISFLAKEIEKLEWYK